MGDSCPFTAVDEHLESAGNPSAYVDEHLESARNLIAMKEQVTPVKVNDGLLGPENDPGRRSPLEKVQEGPEIMKSLKPEPDQKVSDMDTEKAECTKAGEVRNTESMDTEQAECTEAKEVRNTESTLGSNHELAENSGPKTNGPETVEKEISSSDSSEPNSPEPSRQDHEAPTPSSPASAGSREQVTNEIGADKGVNDAVHDTDDVPSSRIKPSSPHSPLSPANSFQSEEEDQNENEEVKLVEAVKIPMTIPDTIGPPANNSEVGLLSPVSIPQPFEPPTSPTPCMKGHLLIKDGYHVCDGEWGMTKEAHDVGDVSKFEYKSNLPSPIESFPHCGFFKGHFMVRQPPPRQPIKVEEKALFLKFVKNTAGTYNLEGNGSNRYGVYTMAGLLQPNGTVEFYRVYQTIKVPGQRRGRQATPKNKKTTSAPKRKPTASLAPPEQAPTKPSLAPVAVPADPPLLPKRTPRISRGSWKDIEQDEKQPSTAKSTTKGIKRKLPVSVGSEGADVPAQRGRVGRPGRTSPMIVMGDEGGESRGGGSASGGGIGIGEVKWSKETQRQAQEFMTFMMTRKNSFWFNEPVDPEVLNIPDYFDVISKPMDFGTVSSKLKAGMYRGLEAMATDMRLTLKNALTYNHQKDSPVNIAAREISKMFEERYRKLREKIVAAELAKKGRQRPKKTARGPGLAPQAGGLGPGSGDVVPASYLAKMQEQMLQMQQTILALQQAQGGGSGGELGGSGQPAASVPDAFDSDDDLPPLGGKGYPVKGRGRGAGRGRGRGRPRAAVSEPVRGDPRLSGELDEDEGPMSFQEKRSLSENINRLAPDKLTRVVQIIQESIPFEDRPDDDEIEIDIDSLDPPTLRKLERLCKDSLPR